MHFAGQGAMYAKRKLAKNGNLGEFSFANDVIQLNYVKAYKHLGTRLSFETSFASEVAPRAAIIRTSINTLYYKCFLKNNYTTHKRVLYTKAYVMSRRCFQDDNGNG